ncbi:MAG: sugar phosphate isomerase/epimerase family protein [bacterium]|nr:sugar phosphate isomerase/epimerase [Candidatus Sumerlaeota bacterium]
MQNFEKKNAAIRKAFLQYKASHPERMKPLLNLSWSNWGFGMESLAVSVKRLAANGIKHIELHGNRYGPDLGYKSAETRKILSDHGVQCSGICGMFSAENELAGNSGRVRQNAIDYIRSNLDLGAEMGARYFLVVPAAVGRPQKIDECEFERAVEALCVVAPLFKQTGIRGAVEPIRSAEVSIVHTFADALCFIEAVDSPGIQHINGDVYHMQVEESHIATTLWKSGRRLTNLHMADSNRCALGEGSLDLDTIIMALYLIGYNNDMCFVTPEPLGPGGDPYPAMYGKPDSGLLDRLVKQTAATFREREKYVRNLSA